MEDIRKPENGEHDDRDTARPPAKPGPRNGQGHPPSSTGEGNTTGGRAGMDANDPDTIPTP